MRESLDAQSKMKRDVRGKHMPFLEVKLLPGVGRRVDLPEGLSREATIRWAKQTVKSRFFDHSAWVHLSETDHVFLRGIN